MNKKTEIGVMAFFVIGEFVVVSNILFHTLDLQKIFLGEIFLLILPIPEYIHLYNKHKTWTKREVSKRMDKLKQGGDKK